jgi:hypothetical protein
MIHGFHADRSSQAMDADETRGLRSATAAFAARISAQRFEAWSVVVSPFEEEDDPGCTASMIA